MPRRKEPQETEKDIVQDVYEGPRAKKLKRAFEYAIDRTIKSTIKKSKDAISKINPSAEDKLIQIRNFLHENMGNKVKVISH
jgi:hypothetical protein